MHQAEHPGNEKIPGLPDEEFANINKIGKGWKERVVIFHVDRDEETEWVRLLTSLYQ